MEETMRAADGIGLAAPQVDHPIRAFIVNVAPSGEKGQKYELINPHIRTDSGKVRFEEGCLSVPGLGQLVRRKNLVTVDFQDRFGKACSLQAEGLLAVAIQHENDHLDGILFIDRLSALKRFFIRRKLQPTNRSFPKLVFLFAFLSLLGCSGLRGKADTLFEKGAYREAIEVYNAALAENPRDERVVASLKKARTQFLDHRLIETRKARLAGNSNLALEILMELVTLQNEWSFYPKGALANTQEEETQEALLYLEQKVAQAKSKDRPLFALYLLQHYQPILEGPLSSRREYLLRQLRTDGKKQCSALSRTLSNHQPYYSEFVQKVCSAWGIWNTAKKPVLSKQTELYRKLNVAFLIRGMPASLKASLKSTLEKSFEESPWFDSAGSRVLAVTLKGDFLQTQTRTPENRVHGFHVEIPYTTYETTVLSNGETKQRPITRFRSDPRFQTYNGWNLTQELALHVQTQLSLAGNQRPLNFERRTSQQGFEHHWNLPQIGLHPESVSLENPQSWVEQQAIFLGADFLRTSEEIWDQLYCEQTAPETTLMSTGDQVHRCLRYRHSNPPDFANIWYEKFFGLTVAQANELLKLADL
jgi:peptide deformylase